LVGKQATTISPASRPQNGKTTPIERGPVASFQKKWWSKDPRLSIAPKELELAIAEAVRKTAPGCDDFVGVIVDRKKPKMRFDPNWEIRGESSGRLTRRWSVKFSLRSSSGCSENFDSRIGNRDVANSCPRRRPGIRPHAHKGEHRPPRGRRSRLIRLRHSTRRELARDSIFALWSVVIDST